MNIPDEALPIAEALIDHFEGFRPTPYWDALGKVWTIGTGFTTWAGKAVTCATPPITQLQNDAALVSRLAGARKLAESGLTRALAACQAGALLDIIWNTGGHDLPSLFAMLNKGNDAGAADDFLAYDESRGAVVGGLADRRHTERAVFLNQLNALDTAALEAFHTAATAARHARTA